MPRFSKTSKQVWKNLGAVHSRRLHLSSVCLRDVSLWTFTATLVLPCCHLMCAVLSYIQLSAIEWTQFLNYFFCLFEMLP
ncbi:hypothetical protein AALO_G00288560 [Alosa alosa]|uniref:Uncharacterized protein n=1 Tax=Alosa alosa TaxID=278164 RepID=A0AAV6FL46_9TELE|nr:hypothetical protein AALO_G00288560 [Alosa alosa]